MLGRKALGDETFLHAFKDARRKALSNGSGRQVFIGGLHRAIAEFECGHHGCMHLGRGHFDAIEFEIQCGASIVQNRGWIGCVLSCRFRDQWGVIAGGTSTSGMCPQLVHRAIHGLC